MHRWPVFHTLTMIKGRVGESGAAALEPESWVRENQPLLRERCPKAAIALGLLE